MGPAHLSISATEQASIAIPPGLVLGDVTGLRPLNNRSLSREVSAAKCLTAVLSNASVTVGASVAAEMIVAEGVIRFAYTSGGKELQFLLYAAVALPLTGASQLKRHAVI